MRAVTSCMTHPRGYYTSTGDTYTGFVVVCLFVLFIHVSLLLLGKVYMTFIDDQAPNIGSATHVYWYVRTPRSYTHIHIIRHYMHRG